MPYFVAKIGIRTVHCYLHAALGVAEIKLQKLEKFSSTLKDLKGLELVII